MNCAGSVLGRNVIFTRDNSTNFLENISQPPMPYDPALPHKFSLSRTIYLASRRVHTNILSIFQTSSVLDDFRITGQSAGLQTRKYVSRPRASLAQLLTSAMLQLSFTESMDRVLNSRKIRKLMDRVLNARKIRKLMDRVLKSGKILKSTHLLLNSTILD